jgi:hypothetical protein
VSQLQNGRAYCYHCNKTEPLGTVRNHMHLYWDAGTNAWRVLVDKRLDVTPPSEYLPYVILGWKRSEDGTWIEPLVKRTPLSSSSHWDIIESDDDEGKSEARELENDSTRINSMHMNDSLDLARVKQSANRKQKYIQHCKHRHLIKSLGVREDCVNMYGILNSY